MWNTLPFPPTTSILVKSQEALVIAIVLAAWWTLVALAGMLRWRRVAAAGASAS
ncbi:MAG: hypothetical protein ACRDOB_22270 [Streptosporangiaceae bacterium]